MTSISALRLQLRRQLCAATFATLAAVPMLAHAETDTSRPAGKEPPMLSLSAAASSELAQDRVTITLANEIEGPDQAKLSQQLNLLLDKTLAQARRSPDVTAHSGNYSVFANTDRDGKITGWRGRAELILESKNFVAASQLAGDLSTQMPVSNIAFSLSNEARQAEEQRLLAEAAQAFGARATQAAKAFGFTGYTIKQINLGGSGTVTSPRPEMRTFAMAAKADAVPLESGKATVTVSVQGTIYLAP